MSELNPQVPGEEAAEVAPVESAPAHAKEKPVKATKASRAVAGDGVPDQSEVDPNKIDRAVLTKQGWVVPTAKPKA